MGKAARAALFILRKILVAKADSRYTVGQQRECNRAVSIQLHKDLAAGNLLRLSANTMLEAPIMAKLTEQDILNWEGDDYMNADHLEFFKDRLLQMQQELLNNASATANHLQEQEATPDPADRATLEEEYALELRTRDRERKLLQKIQASLRQIEDGSYGFCEDTGEPIGLKRLIARPTATLSVEAQERRERMKRQYAD